MAVHVLPGRGRIHWLGSSLAGLNHLGFCGLLPAALGLLREGGNILCRRCRTEQQRSEDKQPHHLEKLRQALGQS